MGDETTGSHRGDRLFSVDAPGVDVAELEARVRDAVEQKRGVRFTDDDLAELRSIPLEPRLRREDLPRGWLDKMPEVRSRLPELAPSPAPIEARVPPPETIEVADPGPLADFDPVGELYASGSAGLKGRLLALLRRIFRPLFRATLNLDHVLTRMAEGDREAHRQARELQLRVDESNRRLERSFDILKESLDQRVDNTADWAGEHISEMTGRLEKWHERSLHLSHNVVYEITNVRLDLEQMQDRLNDLTRRLDMVAARERALEEVALGNDADPDDGES